MLNCLFDIRTNSARFGNDLRYLMVDAEQAVPITDRVAFDVIEEDGKCRFFENGEIVDESDEIHALEKIYPLVYGSLMEKMGQPARAHCGCATTPGGKRFIVAGQSGAGKTTLMANMLLQGFPVEGDDCCLISEGNIIPLPRRFHIKEPSFRLLPEIAALAPGLPMVDSGGGYRVYSFSPSDIGRDWRIAPGPIDAVFYLEPNHGGETVLKPASKIDIAQRLMQQGRSSNMPSKWIGDICRIVDTAKCFMVIIGDAASARNAILEALA